MEPTVAGFEIWLDEDVEYQKDKSNDIVGIKSPPSFNSKVMLHCPQCGDSKEVTQREKVSGVFCCEEQMVEEYELPYL